MPWYSTLVRWGWGVFPQVYSFLARWEHLCGDPEWYKYRMYLRLPFTP